MKWLKRFLPKPFHRSHRDVAKFIEDFLMGHGEPYDWDDFISIPIGDDPYLEGIRLQCGDLPGEYPPPPGVHAYCNDRGIQILKEVLDELRQKCTEETDDAEQPQ